MIRQKEHNFTNSKLNLSSLEKYFFKELLNSMRIYKKKNGTFMVSFEPVSIPENSQPEGDAAFRKVSLIMFNAVTTYLEDYKNIDEEKPVEEVEKELKKRLLDLL